MNRLPYGLKRIRARSPELIGLSLRERKRVWEPLNNAYSPLLTTTGQGSVVWDLVGKAGPIDLKTGRTKWLFEAGSGLSFRAQAPAVFPDCVLFPSAPRDKDGKLIPEPLTPAR